MNWTNKYHFPLWALVVLLLSSMPRAQIHSSNSAAIYRQTAQMYERAGQTLQAAEYYARACRENPADIAAYLGAKRMFMRASEYEKFAELIKSLQAKRRDIRYSVDLALVDYKLGNKKEALQKWQHILEENANNQQSYSLVGQAMVENDLFEEAIQVYKNGRRKLKNQSAFVFELADIFKTLEQYNDLIEEYFHSLENNPEQVVFIQSELQRLARQSEDNTALVKVLIKRTDDKKLGWAASLFLGDIFLAQKDYGMALKYYLSAERSLPRKKQMRPRTNFPKGRFLFSVGEAALKDGDSEHAESAFRTLIKEFSDGAYRARAELGLTQVLLQREAYEDAIDSLQRFIVNNKTSMDTWRALVLIGDIYFDDLNDIEQARSAYSKAYADFKDNRLQLQVLFKLADCAVAQDSMKKAESLLGQIVKRARSRENNFKNNALLGLSRLKFYQGQPTTALKILDDLEQDLSSAGEPDLLENDVLQLQLLLQENQYDSTGLAKLGTARLYKFQKKYQEALNVLQNFIKEQPKSMVVEHCLLEEAELFELLGQFENAITVLSKIYENSEGLYRDLALLKIGTIYQEKLALWDKAEMYYEMILAEFPNSIYIEEARTRIWRQRKKGEHS